MSGRRSLLSRLFSRTMRTRVWCSALGLEVEVEYERRGFPGFRHSLAVRGCSIFEPGEAVACRRRCLDVAFRKQWEPPLPIVRYSLRSANR